MQPFTILRGVAAPLLLPNIDTDTIIRIERLTASDQSRLGDFALEALRFAPDGSEDPDFILNQPKFRTAPILIAAENFGCGSSREGAVTALLARGIRSIVAPSFGEIFYGNCFQNGVLPVRLDADAVERLAADALAGEADTTVDLVAQQITSARGAAFRFEIDSQQRQALLTGLDDLDQSLRLMPDILAWQRQDRLSRPWVWYPPSP